MKTQFKKVGDTVVVSVGGRLDIEAQVPLKEDLSKLMTKVRTDSAPRKIIFNFEDLEFVGSSGISSFVATLRDFNSRAPMKPRYCHVGLEFRKVIEAFDERESFEFFESFDHAKKSFDQ